MVSKTVLKISILIVLLALAFGITTTYLSLSDPKAQNIDKEKLVNQIMDSIKNESLDNVSNVNISSSSSTSTTSSVEGAEDSYQTLTPNIDPTTVLEVTGYIADFAFKPGLTTLKSNLGSFNAVSPVWYSLDPKVATGLSKRSTAANKELLTLAKKNSIEVIPSIAQFEYPDLSVVLNDEKKRNAHINEIVKVVTANSYAGIDLDYENIAEEDKANFQIFVTSLHEKLQKDNKKLIVTVLAKDFTNENGSPTRRAQDWKFLGENADQVRIMVYDYQNIEKQIYNISPIKEIEDVIKYAQAKIPNEKISIGLPLYAYSYLDGKKTALTYKDILNIRTKQKVISDEMDLVNKEKIITYEANGKTIIAYYTDAEVDNERRNLLKNMGITKMFYWRLGDEDTQIYTQN